MPERRQRADHILAEISEVAALELSIEPETATVGGGSLPGVELPTIVLRLRHCSLSAEEPSRQLRLGAIRIFGPIHQEAVLLDLRSVLPEDDSRLALAVRLVAAG